MGDYENESMIIVCASITIIATLHMYVDFIQQSN